jgi:hypothetical protein
MTTKIEVTTKDDIIKSIKNNHIWLNAFHCIDSTPEYCENIGRTIIELLNQKSKLLPLYLESANGEEIHPASLELATLTPTLYLSINKS